MQTRTTLSPSYLLALGRSILAPSSQTSLLIILDLNGVLLERQKNSGKTRAAHAAAKSLRQPSFRLNGHDIWLRPYGDFFLAYVAARHTLGIWSSATEKTVSGILSDPRFLPSGAQPFFVHTRDSCIPDTVTGGHATLKPLSAVFTKRYRKDNTLIIDDSPTKVVRDPSNAVIVPEYSAENSKVDYSRDETLLWTALYLEHVATDFRKGEDIRERIQESGGLKGLRKFTNDAKRVALSVSGVASCRAFLPGFGDSLDTFWDEGVIVSTTESVEGARKRKKKGWRKSGNAGQTKRNESETGARGGAFDVSKAHDYRKWSSTLTAWLPLLFALCFFGLFFYWMLAPAQNLLAQYFH